MHCGRDRHRIVIACAFLRNPLGNQLSAGDVLDIVWEPNWLDCVAAGAWDAVVTKGKLPYVKKRKFGLSTLSRPLLTPGCGMQAHGTNLNHQHEALGQLVIRTMVVFLSNVSACWAKEVFDRISIQHASESAGDGRCPNLAVVNFRRILSASRKLGTGVPTLTLGRRL